MGTLLPLNQIDARPYCPEPFSEPDGMRDIHACLPLIDKRHPFLLFLKSPGLMPCGKVLGGGTPRTKRHPPNLAFVSAAPLQWRGAEFRQLRDCQTVPVGSWTDGLWAFSTRSAGASFRALMSYSVLQGSFSEFINLMIESREVMVEMPEAVP
jgi:hypothetical protein